MKKKISRIKGYKRTQCNQGHNHQSKGEARYCNKLAFLVKIKEIKEYHSQENVPIMVNQVKVCTMRIDFLVILNNGSKEFHEFKGYETDIYKLKYKLFKACYPDEVYLKKTYKDLK